MKRLRLTIDRTALNILSLVVGTVGIVGALSDAGVPPPDVHGTYFGSNPFAIKREIIDSYLAFGFALLAGAMLLLQLGMEISHWPKANRQRSWRYYFGTLVVASLASWGLFHGVVKTSQHMARREWHPLIVDQMRESFEHARIVIGRKGETPLVNVPTPTEQQIREERLRSAERDLFQIERLLDIDSPATDLPSRVNRLSAVFSASSGETP